MDMKKAIILSGIASLILVSCSTHEVEKSHLLEYRVNGVYSSSRGYAVKYTAYKNDVAKRNIWNIYQTGTDAISIWVPDSTFTKNTYEYPDFSAEYITSGSKTYHATAGQFRLLGIEMGDLMGDFQCKLKNNSNPNDSLMITAGYLRIYLEYQDSLLIK
jgi:hypothetical protein